MTDLRFDEEATKGLLALYVTPDVVAQRAQFLCALEPRTGERVLDIGSGPGFLAAAIAEATGSSGRVSGIDISEPLLAVARGYCSHLSWVEFRQADATQLPFPDHAFDAAIATQVLEFVRDVDAALSEIHRVLRPGGRVVIVDTDWDSIVWHSPNRERMSRILAAWEQHAADAYLPRTLATKLSRAGFRMQSQQAIPLFNSGYDANTFSNRMIDLIVPFVVGRNGITRDEAEGWARDLRQTGEQGEYFFSLNRYLFIAQKGS
jgi:ubiquinone/menaquinone biosynthesis C-methylase UbiE